MSDLPGKPASEGGEGESLPLVIPAARPAGWSFLGLGAVAAIGGMAALVSGDAGLWGTVFLFLGGLFVALGTRCLRTGAPCLILEPDGLTIRRPIGEERYTWAEVAGFRVSQLPNQRLAVVDRITGPPERPGDPPPTKDRTLPMSTEYSPEQLVSLLESWRVLHTPSLGSEERPRLPAGPLPDED